MDQHLKMLKQKLIRENRPLAKTRYYLPPNLQRTLYFSIFESHLRYGCQIWGQQKSQQIHEQFEFEFLKVNIVPQNHSL